MIKNLRLLGLILSVGAASVTPGLVASSVYAASADVRITTAQGKYAVGSQLVIEGVSPAGKDITLKVIDSNNLPIHVDAIYAKDNQGTFQFSFTVPTTTASSLTLIAGYGSGQGEFSIKKVDIGITSPPGGGPGGGMGSGGGTGSKDNTPATPSTTVIQLGGAAKETIKGNEVAVTFDTAKLTELVSKASSATSAYTVDIKADASVVRVELTAEALTLLGSKSAQAVLKLNTQAGDYELPIQQVDLVAAAKQLGVDAKDLKLSIAIDKLQGEAAAAVNSFAGKLGADVLAGPVHFTVSVTGSNGKSLEIDRFSTYVARTLHLQKPADPNTSTGVWVNPDTNTYSPVPTVFSGSQATLYRKGNSIYTVIHHSKTFGDLSGHWAKSDVETLASKLIVNGVSESSFAPDSRITRAEFAALLVRSLGLAEVPAEGFKDIAATDWFSGSVGASKQAGLIDGYEDGTFKPNAVITREQMVTMIIRAVKASGKEAALDSSVLRQFTDGSAISAWSKDAVAQSIKAGIVQGMTDTTFAPQDNASRAQGTVMLKRMLQYLKFIN